MAEAKGKSEEATAREKTPGGEAGAGTRGTAQSAGEKAKEATSGMVDAAKEKMHNMAAGASELVEKAKDTAEEWASSVEDAAFEAKDRAQEMASAVGDKMGDLGQELSALVRRHPVPAVLMGVGVGFLLGIVTQRPRSNGY